MHIVLYKLKDVENLKEILRISKQFKFKVHIIKREKSDIDYEKLKKIYDFSLYNSFEEFLERYNDLNFLVLETYGDKLIFDIDISKFDCIVLGAEDYGIPLNEIEKIKKKEIVKIPTKIPGSYNVTSTLVMVLAELMSVNNS